MKKIIFVDDDPTIQDVVHLILDEDYEIESMLTGNRIMDNQFDVPDLFLLDRQLSGLDGLDICKFLKNQNSTKDIPVIIISATPNISQLARASGADVVVEKPFQIRELRQIIAEQINRS